MSYEWGSAVFPAATFRGQVQIDSTGKIFRWDDSSQAWLVYSEAHLEELRSFMLYTNGMGWAQDPFERKQKLARNHWDQAFDKAFILVESIQDPNVVYGRIAHVSFAELLAWLPTVVPGYWVGPTGSYGEHCRIRVLQPVDPRYQPDRMAGWNNLYGALRGRDAYRSKKGRNRAGLPASCVLSTHGDHWGAFSPSPEVQLVEMFCGQTPLTPEPRSIWFPRKQNNLSSLPHNTMAVIKPTDPGRWCWNVATQAWEAVISDHWQAANGNVSNPACFVVGGDVPGGTIEVTQLRYVMRSHGTGFVTKKLSICVVYQLRDMSDMNRRAFFVKPMGITHQAADLHVGPADWDLISVARFVGDGSNARFKKVAVQDRLPNDGWRWDIHEAMPAISNSVSGMNSWSLNTQVIPNELRYYIRNNLTGVASPYFPGSVEIARRRYNMAMGFLEKRG